MAAKVLALPTSAPGGYTEMTFGTSSGPIRNRAGLVPVRLSETFRYHTESNGAAMSREFVVLARDIGVKDSNKDEIYEASCGTLFVEKYYGGSPSDFDELVLKAPKFE